MATIYLKDESYAIVGAAMEVYNQLGPGFLEAVYQEALEIELGSRNIPFSAQKELGVFYKDRQLKKAYIPDFFVYGKIIVELKAQSNLTDCDLAQLINYLKVTNVSLGILLNFGNPETLERKRVIRPGLAI